MNEHTEPAEPMVNIQGVEVPQSELLAQYNPRCNYCTEGWQHYTEGGKERRRICGCAVKGMRRKLAGQAAPTLIGRVVKTPAAQEAARAHAKKELERMRALLLEAEEQLARHIEGHDAGIAENEAHFRSIVGMEQGIVDDYECARRDLAELLLKYVHIARWRVTVQGNIVVSVSIARERAQRALLDLRLRSAAIRAAPELRHRIERIKTRIALYRQRKAELLGEEDGGVDDFEMEVQHG
jgi:hypothetical protein